MLFVTTAMKPPSDFTTPRTLICPISRHFLPVEQPEPEDCCTTGLKKGSRLPLIAHFFSSGFGAGLTASAAVWAGVADFSSAAIFVATTCLGLADPLLAATAAVAAFGAAGVATAATFAAVACFAAVVRFTSFAVATI